MAIFRKYQQGDRVQYIGNKFAKDIGTNPGVVDVHVGGTDTELVVSFGSDSYVLDEKYVMPFQGKPKAEYQEKNTAKYEALGADVIKRKGGSKRRESEDDNV